MYWLFLCLCIMFSMIVYSWLCIFFFFKQKTAYEMRISDWSSDVCSSDLLVVERRRLAAELHRGIDLDLDAPVGLGLDLARPGLDEVLVGSRGRRQEVLQAQDHLLRRGRRAREAAGHRR